MFISIDDIFSTSFKPLSKSSIVVDISLGLCWITDCLLCNAVTYVDRSSSNGLRLSGTVGFIIDINKSTL